MHSLISASSLLLTGVLTMPQMTPAESPLRCGQIRLLFGYMMISPFMQFFYTLSPDSYSRRSTQLYKSCNTHRYFHNTALYQRTQHVPALCQQFHIYSFLSWGTCITSPLKPSPERLDSYHSFHCCSKPASPQSLIS